ncbi:anthocyanidin 3-O-galactosyltransferase 3GT1-like [Corylus avellana]|uniref:anthocyanidin 3-O-galactosyltransferase 3GT1-like n=1 Tax=Corylus avellana TaxID=13451 RepID=UPI00286CB3AC|nr:anthocyanidin 3-O-galactosyltransferase 3GT1-like [Corylus avellana]
MQVITESCYSEEKHVALLAFPFGSHPSSSLTLLRKLATAAPNILFSFLNTPNSNHSILSKTKSDDNVVPHNIKFHDVTDGVPEGHVLTGNPIEPLNLFLNAMPENLKKGIDTAEAKTGKRISCLLSDAFLTCASGIAEDMNVPWIPISSCLPSALSAHVYTDLIRECCGKGRSGKLDFIPGLSAMHVADLPEEVLSPSAGNEEESPLSRTLSQMGLVLPRANAIIMGSFEELNPPPLNHDLKSKFKNVLYVGALSLSLPPLPLPPSTSDLTGCLSWLDGKKCGSVAYIGFGTAAALPHDDVIAIAEALQTSETLFLWSLSNNLKEFLPEGFLEKTRMRGKVEPWTPQSQVLAHASVGVFVTHCGANSVYESVVDGVPLICRPIFADHHMMGRMIEEVWGNGIIVEGGPVDTPKPTLHAVIGG